MLTFQVADMSCGHCASAITQAVQFADASAKIEIDLDAHQVKIDGAADQKKVAQAIREAGYTPVIQEN